MSLSVYTLGADRGLYSRAALTLPRSFHSNRLLLRLCHSLCLCLHNLSCSTGRPSMVLFDTAELASVEMVMAASPEPPRCSVFVSFRPEVEENTLFFSQPYLQSSRSGAVHHIAKETQASLAEPQAAIGHHIIRVIMHRRLSFFYLYLNESMPTWRGTPSMARDILSIRGCQETVYNNSSTVVVSSIGLVGHRVML